MSIFLARKNTQPHEFKAWLENMMAADRQDATGRELSRLYATSVVAYRAGNKRADNVALVPMVIKDKAGEPLSKTQPIMTTLSRNYRDNMRRSELSLCFWGRNLLWKRRNYSGTVFSLRWINPTMWQPIYGTKGVREFNVMRRSRGEYIPVRTIKPRDAVFMHGFDFENDFDGVAPAEVALRYIELGVEMAETQVSFMKNRAVPTSVLQPAEDTEGPDEPERNRIQSLLERAYKGSHNAGRTLVQRFRWQWIQMQANWDEMAFTEQFDQSFEAVSMAFDIPIALIRESASNYAQAEVARRDWAQSWLVPRVGWYAEIYTEHLAQDEATIRKYGTGLTVEPDMTNVAILKEDVAAKTNVLNAQVTGGYRDLYSAALEGQIKDPDKKLKGYYMWGGMPVHISKIDELRPVQLSMDTSTEPGQVDESAHPLTPRPEEAGGATIPHLPSATQTETPPEGSKSICVMIGLGNNADLIALQNTVKQRYAGISVEWKPPEDFHVTLIYAPTVTDAQINALRASMEEISWPEDMALRVGSLNSFDNLGQHALHFRIRNNADLAELQETLYDVCMVHGIQLSTYSLPQNFKAHITMGDAEQKPPAITFHSKITVQPQELQFAVGDDIVYRRKWVEESEAPAEEKPEPEKRKLSDAIYKEMTDWQRLAERKGRGYAFEPIALKGHDVVTFIKEALAGEYEIEQVFDVAKTALLDKVEVEVAFERLEASKGADDYRRTIRGQVRGFWGGSISKFDFVDGMYSAVRRNFRAAWMDVAREFGRNEFTEAENNRLEDEINGEARFITGFADAIESGTKANGGALTPLFARADLWVGGFDRQRELAKVVFGEDRKFKWVWDPTIEAHCDDCATLNGRVYLGSTWAAMNIAPRSSRLQCTGRRCGCSLIETDEPITKGRPPAIRGPQKSVGDEHEHTEEESQEAVPS